VLPGIDGLRYQRNEENRGFIDSCNAGAALARAEYLVFLNNDTVVQPGWLDALLQTFSQHPDTGLAGSKLVYPDGRLQEAGGIVFTDGSAANHGRNHDPGDPRYNFVREVDYCSGAALAIRQSLFGELGGFDEYYRPAYFEDTDLAMRVRQRGFKVRYQPASVVVHFEGASSGTDTRRGVKAYQISNQKKFAARWISVLGNSQPVAKKRILVIDAHTPRPDRDSGSARMVELMGLLLEEDCTVDFFSQSLAHDGHYTDALQQLGVQVWWTPWIGKIPVWLAEHGRRFDAIIVSRHYVLSPLLPLLRKWAPQAQIVFDSVDLHFLRESRQAAQAGDKSATLAAERTRATELGLLRAVDKTWVVSAFERELLAQIEPSASLDVVSNIHSISANSPGFANRADLVFVGGYLHLPNLDAARWLLAEIFPIVRQALPSIRLHLVGADAPASLLEMAQSPGVEIHGHVPDLESLLDRTRIALAPLRYGAGVKGKINQSLARGLPIVATHCAVEGMHLVDGQDALCADTAQEFADAIIGLYGDEPLWQRLRVAGIENTRRHFSRDAARAVIRPWLDGLRSG
jgi:glycosyltransferase involved in cell wall biosynthesis